MPCYSIYCRILYCLLGYLHPSDKHVEFDICQKLYEAIGNHLAYWDVQEWDLLDCNLVANIIILDVYVLDPSVEE